MPKYIYPAVFTSEEDEVYFINFPDITSCYTQGESLADAYEMAQDVLCLTLYNIEQDGNNIPLPSNLKDIKIVGNSFVSLVSADTTEYRRFYDNKAVKKTLTVPSWLNDMAEKNEVNFSYTLQKALKKELNIQE